MHQQNNENVLGSDIRGIDEQIIESLTRSCQNQEKNYQQTTLNYATGRWHLQEVEDEDEYDIN